MNTTTKSMAMPQKLGKPFWVVWAVELWERFGFYGVQAILAMYFVKQLGYSETESFYVFGSFSAFVYGFVWIGGWIGDKYLGAKRTMMLGGIVLMFAYAALALATRNTIFYALAGIVVGNALFKANPSSIISKMYAKGDTALDSAMTMYYMGVNLGAFFSMAITPIIAQNYGWGYAYGICSAGLFFGLLNYFFYRHLLDGLNTDIEKQAMCLKRLSIVIGVSVAAIILIAHLLYHTQVCDVIVYTVVGGAFLYFLRIAFSLHSVERARMIIALVLIIQAVIFFVLYNQMPTSLTFFAMHNIDNNFHGWMIPPAEYQVLNSLVIVIMAPILAWLYRLFPATHVSKFCIGMTLCALGFLVLAIPSFTSITGLASPWWLVLSYFLQSTGELFISALGLAMVAELCPTNRSGFVMGVWFLSVMLSGPIGAWIGALTVPSTGVAAVNVLDGMHLYGKVFLEIGVVTGVITLLMWLARPALNRLLAN